jgi:hypothetical protein
MPRQWREVAIDPERHPQPEFAVLHTALDLVALESSAFGRRSTVANFNLTTYLLATSPSGG